MGVHDTRDMFILRLIRCTEPCGGDAKRCVSCVCVEPGEAPPRSALHDQSTSAIDRNPNPETLKPSRFLSISRMRRDRNI